MLTFHWVESLGTKIRSSCWEVFCKKDVLRNFAKFTGKHLCKSLFFNNKNKKVVASGKVLRFTRLAFRLTQYLFILEGAWNPVDTWRRFNINKTSETTSCVYCKKNILSNTETVSGKESRSKKKICMSMNC